MKLALSLLLTAVSLGAACGGSTVSTAVSLEASTSDASITEGGPGQTFALCNSSADVRLKYIVGGGAPGSEGEFVMSENGDALLAIDGQCNFWSYRYAWSSGLRSGHLSPEQEAALVEQLGLAAWPSLGGSWSTSLCDGPSAIYKLDDTTIDVAGGCGDSDAPTVIKQLNTKMAAVLTSLEAAFPEPDSGVRAVVYKYMASDPNTYPSPLWPLSIDPGTIAVTVEEARMLHSGQSTLIPDPADGAKLRALRDTFLSGKYAGSWSEGFQLSFVDAGGARYGIWFRSVMPGEDKNGILQFL